jgi:hypothetical protein
MSVLRLRITSIFLLVLLLRVLLPDSVVLALHRHTHTTDKQLDRHFGEQQVDVQHIHCETDHSFQKSFYAWPPAFSLPVFTDHRTAYLSHYPAIWKFTFSNNTRLRGPPALRA